MTDKEIIIGIRENDAKVWRYVYQQMKPAIRNGVEPLLRNVSNVTFDDVYEDGLVALMENVKDGRLDENTQNNISGYLYTLCWRIALKKARRANPFIVVGGTDADGDTTGVRLENIGSEDGQLPESISEDEKFAFDFLERMLSSLPENCKQIFKRFYWDKLPMDEIAPIMGLRNANSAKTTKNRCMDKFKELARQALADDEAAEQAIRRTVERSSLRDLLEQFRLEDNGSVSIAACVTEKDKESDPEG